MLRRWWPLLAVACLLAAALIAASMTSLPVVRLPTVELSEMVPPTPKPETIPTRAASAPKQGVALPSWIMLAAFLVLIGGMLVVVIKFFGKLGVRAPRFQRRSLRQRPVKAPVELVAEEVVAALDAGLLELDDDEGDPRAAVIACWVRLERAAASAGTPRRPGDTSTDLVVRMLSGHDLSASTLADFAAIYRRARYATHEVDMNMREKARDALHELRSELAGAVTA